MKIRILDPATRRVTNWSGGTTAELFLYPFDGSYADRRFMVRISSATIDLLESRFTPLPGVTRYLTPLSEGFYLKRNGRPSGGHFFTERVTYTGICGYSPGFITCRVFFVCCPRFFDFG